MEASDQKLLQELLPNNHRLQKLWDKHLELEKKLEGFSKRPYLSDSEEAEERLLKKQKLLGRDEIFQILQAAR